MKGGDKNMWQRILISAALAILAALLREVLEQQK